MSALINLYSQNAYGHEKGYSNKLSSPSWPPKSPVSVIANPGFKGANPKQRSNRKDGKVLREKSCNGATKKVKSPIPPRPSSRQRVQSKEQRSMTPKSNLHPPIWRFDENNMEEEKKEDFSSSPCHVLLTSHSFSPELAVPSHHYEWQLPAQKSHRRAQSWDAGDYSFWLSSTPVDDSGDCSREHMHDASDHDYHGNSNDVRDTYTEERSCQSNSCPNESRRSENSRESFQKLRHAIRIAKNKAMMNNNWGNYKTVAQLLHRLAGVYFENEEVFASQATLEDALEMYQHVLALSRGDERDACLLDIADIICNLGSIELHYKNYELAIARFTEALEIQKGGQDHSKVIASLDNLGYSFFKCKYYKDALIHYEDMLNTQLFYYQTLNAECYETLGKQLVMYEKLNDLKGAAKVTKRAIETALNLPNVSNEYIDKLQRLRSEVKKKSKRWRR